MNTQTSTQAWPPVAVQPDREGFLAGLCAVRFRWDVVHPFPKQNTADRTTGTDQLMATSMTRKALATERPSPPSFGSMRSAR